MSAQPHFRFLGIPVRIEPLFWVVVVFLALNLQEPPLIIIWVAVVLVSVLVHEFGHALALKAFGQSSSVVLHGFGGLTFSQRRLGRAQSIIVSLAGPLTALFLLGVPAYLLRESELGFDLALDHFRSGGGFGLWPVLVFATYVNIWWSLANLLPIRPLDGGNVLTEIIGIQPARVVSIVVGGAAAVWAYTHSTDFQMVAFFAAFLAFINLSEYRRAAQGERAPSAFDVDAPTPTGGGGVRPGTVASGSRGPRPVPRESGWPTRPPGPPSGPAPAEPAGTIDAESAERLGWNLLRQGNVSGAEQILARSRTPVSGFLRAAVTIARGGGVEPMVDAYLAMPTGPSNLVTAAVLDDRGAVDGVVGQLLGNGPVGADAAHTIQTHLHYAERFASAARVGERIHAATASRAQVAFDTACAWTRCGEMNRAIGWLDRAIDDGFSSGALLDGEPDLGPVRAHPDWPRLRSRVP